MIIQGDASHIPLPDESIDCIVTDPPYGYSFMNKDWDKVVIPSETWKECLRVLKPGAFAFVMSAPRQDVLSRAICNLQDAGFETGFSSIVHTFASGFPKAANVSKLVDKRNGCTPNQEFRDYIRSKLKDGKTVTGFEKILREKKLIGINSAVRSHYFCATQAQLPTLIIYEAMKEYLGLDNRFDTLIEREEAEREILETKHRTPASQSQTSHEYGFGEKTDGYYDITKSATEQAKALDGGYCGAQFKPAVEIVLVCMKPIKNKSYVDQALEWVGQRTTILQEIEVELNKQGIDKVEWE